MSSMPIRSAALGEQLASLLRARIVRGELSPGTHLVEDTLASDHGVSRGPVRDALKVLLAEGLIESRRRGYYTKLFTQHDVAELYEVRSAAERLAGELAIARGAGADWTAAERDLDRMRQYAEVRDEAAFAVADLAFHTEFYRASGNSRLLALWQQYEPTFATLLEITNAQDADLTPSYQDHKLLLDLAKGGDVERFVAVLGDHLEGSRRRLSSAVAAR
ncbi:MAG: GntR family transcriptional regulator [Arachnia sp.]